MAILPVFTNEEFRRINMIAEAGEFDKAVEAADEFLNSHPDSAEGYFMRLLCAFGVTYIHEGDEFVPTVNRMQVKSIYSDENYKKAMELSDENLKNVIDRETDKIAEIQKNVLSIVQKETPYDVFICYKQTDADGERTKDSVLASEVYEQLKREGFKVFFAEVSLESKAGQAYEPYIFGALNSAKVMLVIGTSADNMNAPWVKNEWSRFMSFTEEGKELIPCIYEMDSYDLPEAFAHLPIMDMSKIGFISEIVRIIRKRTAKVNPLDVKKINGIEVSNSDITVYNKGRKTAFATRGDASLEFKDFTRAISFYDKALKMDGLMGDVILHRLMALSKVSTKQEFREKIIAQAKEDIESDNGSALKALRRIETLEWEKIHKYGNGESREFVTSLREEIQSMGH